MNCYRVRVRFSEAALPYTYDIDAASIGSAVSKVLRGFSGRADEARISVRTVERNVTRTRRVRERVQ